MSETWTGIRDSIAAYLPNLLGALAVLVVGWLVALIVAGIVRSVLQRTHLDRKLTGLFREQGDSPPDVARGVGKGVFWVLMAFVLIAFFQALGLTMAVGPLSNLLDQVMIFLPRIFSALILLLVAWMLASLLRMLVTRGMRISRVDEKVALAETGEESAARPLSSSLGEAAYWLVFLLFLPAVLGALRMEGLLGPVQAMLDKLLGFLPNILAAGLIALVGVFVAKILRRIVSSLLAATGVDRFGGRVGIAQISGLAGLVVYILVLIPVLVAALNALALEAVTRPASAMLDTILAAIPGIFAAAVVLTIATVIGKILAGLVADLLTGLGFDRLPRHLGLAAATEVEGGARPSRFVGHLVLVAVLAMAVFEAAELLGFSSLSAIVADLTVFGGHILLGVVVLTVGLFLANLAAKAVRASGAAQAGFLAALARVAILMLTGAIAIRQMGLANEIVNLAFGLVLGALAVAAAIAFGIGGRHVAAAKLEQWTGARRD